MTKRAERLLAQDREAFGLSEDDKIEIGPSSGNIFVGRSKIGFVSVGSSPDEAGRYEVNFKANKDTCTKIGVKFAEFTRAFSVHVSQL